MTRPADWPERLLDYIAAREARRFEWGRRANDCCSCAFGWALEAVGIDAMAAIEDYATADEADAILARVSMIEVADAHFARAPVGMLQRGDLALVQIDGADSLMIVEGETLVGPGRRRLERRPRTDALMGWKV